jgi:hypothetical protein
MSNIKSQGMSRRDNTLLTVGFSLRYRNARHAQHPYGVQQVGCQGAGCTPTGYGLEDGYLQPGVYTPGYQDMTAMRSDLSD